MSGLSKDLCNPENGPRIHPEASHPCDPRIIREELQRILVAPSFRSSKRCSEFLRFVVEETLQGRQEDLKERTLGVSLFGRSPAYDTPGDPVVRVKANEVRKRLAQYYDDHSDGPLRIDLAPGSYVPAFRPPHVSAPAEARLPDVDEQIATRHRPALWFVCLTAGIAAVLVFAVWRSRHDSPLDDFWNPVLQSDRTPILCVGASSHVWLLSDRLSAQLGGMLAQDVQPASVAINSREAVPVGNAYFSLGSVKSALDLSAFLSAKGLRTQLRIGGPLSLEDFHSHTILAVGAFSNPWTLERMSELRFRFDRGTTDGKLWLGIADSQDPKNRWRVHESPFESPPIDYALVTRMFDPASKTVFISLAGLNQFGTEAAAEFVTNPAYWEDLIRHAPSRWQSKNLQVVIQTSVVESRPTPPRVVEAYFW